VRRAITTRMSFTTHVVHQFWPVLISARTLSATHGPETLSVNRIGGTAFAGCPVDVHCAPHQPPTEGKVNDCMRQHGSSMCDSVQHVFNGPAAQELDLGIVICAAASDSFRGKALARSERLSFRAEHPASWK